MGPFSDTNTAKRVYIRKKYTAKKDKEYIKEKEY